MKINIEKGFIDIIRKDSISNFNLLIDNSENKNLFKSYSLNELFLKYKFIDVRIFDDADSVFLYKLTHEIKSQGTMIGYYISIYDKLGQFLDEYIELD